MREKRISGFLRNVAIAAVAAFAVCCKGDETITEEAIFRAITPVESELTIQPGGSVSLNFFVTDPGFVFDYNVNSSGFQVVLRAGGGTPDRYSITNVTKGAGKGSYTATITDLGKETDYRDEVQIGLRFEPGTSKEYCIYSSSFILKTEGAESIIVRTGLPIVYINTENGKEITSKENYLNATFSVNGSGAAEGLEEVTCRIRGRGNTTWTWPKKPYLVKFDEQQHLFGMHKHKRYVLLANFMDRTLMRNIVSMKVSSMTNLDWTPGCQSVELVLNGKHVGNYLLIEQVRVDKNRVPVTEMTPEDISGEALSGGYLLECDFHFDNKFQWLSPYGHSAQWIWGRNDIVPFGIKYPDEDDINNTQINYIKDYVNSTAAALYGADFQDPEKGYAAYIDVDSFIDYWIVFEVMGNHELGNPGSVFMHKDRGGKLIAGPCWDFDWGVLSYKTSPHAKTGLVNGNAIWYARLFQDPAFKAKVKARFEELLPQLETIPDFIDETEKTLEQSAELNFAMWDPAQDASINGGSIINGDENMAFHEAVSLLKRIYSERLEVIKKSL